MNRTSLTRSESYSGIIWAMMSQLTFLFNRTKDSPRNWSGLFIHFTTNDLANPV